jgi:hypothetical protein
VQLYIGSYQEAAVAKRKQVYLVVGVRWGHPFESVIEASGIRAAEQQARKLEGVDRRTVTAGYMGPSRTFPLVPEPFLQNPRLNPWLVRIANEAALYRSRFGAMKAVQEKGSATVTRMPWGTWVPILPKARGPGRPKKSEQQALTSINPWLVTTRKGIVGATRSRFAAGHMAKKFGPGTTIVYSPYGTWQEPPAGKQGGRLMRWAFTTIKEQFGSKPKEQTGGGGGKREKKNPIYRVRGYVLLVLRNQDGSINRVEVYRKGAFVGAYPSIRQALQVVEGRR